ncbi:hypothetical protein M378DRAFT_11031 [Amanita muscaria Koide BX008]|uniref:DUF6533 domain-containing protein n=1 Tax=Amanita muscaria (strain Koide BX008) TaxID=946122 RepID=A0A0C2X8U6_AMAMK|nr:hypothetical protein M378DRAFT_11031 [Amanita muscaria Koide BX008]
MTLMVYDHLHTLPMEIRYMWLSRRLTTVNVLYYITKYGIFFSVVELYRLFNRFITVQECHYTIYLYATFSVSIIWAGEAVLGIRIWAIWGKNRYLTIALPIIFCALFITNFVFTLNYIGSLEYGPSPAPQFISCFVTKANENVFAILVCMPAWVALMLVLLTTSAYLAFLHGGNLVLFSRVPLETASVLSIPVNFLHVALASRVILHIRKQADMSLVQDGDEEIWT